MKLKKLSQIQEKCGRPVIRLSMKRGVFTITKAAARKLGITDARQFLEIFNDEESEKDFYICTGFDGFKIRDDKKIAGCFFFSSSFLRNEMKRIYKITEQTAVFIVAGEISHDKKILFALIYENKNI